MLLVHIIMNVYVSYIIFKHIMEDTHRFYTDVLRILQSYPILTIIYLIVVSTFKYLIYNCMPCIMYLDDLTVIYTVLHYLNKSRHVPHILNRQVVKWPTSVIRIL